MDKKTKDEIIQMMNEMLKPLNEWLVKSSKEFDERLKKYEKERQETDLRFKEERKETDLRFKEERRKSDERFEKLRKENEERAEKDRKEFKKDMKELSAQIGGVGNSNGFFAEEFFCKSLENSMRLGEHEFHSLDRDLKRHIKKKNLKGEYDIILTNSDTVVVVEVKYKMSKDYVEKFYNKSLKNFKKLFPIYSNYKLYGAVASMSDPEESYKLAQEYGLYVLGQSGNEIEIINDQVKEI